MPFVIGLGDEFAGCEAPGGYRRGEGPLGENDLSRVFMRMSICRGVCPLRRGKSRAAPCEQADEEEEESA